MLLVCGALRPELDGVADYVVRLADALRAAGATVRILHIGADAALPGARTVGARWTPRPLVEAGRAARGADVVHVQFAPSMYRFRPAIGLMPLVLGRTPLLVTLHEYGWWRWAAWIPGAVWRALERRRVLDRESVLLVPRAVRVLVTNDGHAAALAERFRGAVRADLVPIAANVGVDRGLDRDATRRAVRSELGADERCRVIAFFGFVHPVKGVRYLAEAVAALAAEGRDVRLLVIGGFESMALPAQEARAFEAELRQQLAASGAAASTRITGFLPPQEISRLLTAADVACLPFTAGVTAKSGSLLTVLQHRLPVVVTGGPDPDPALVDGERCVVVQEVRSGEALAAGLRRVFDEPELAERIAGEGAAWASERGWSVVARAHLEIYAAARGAG